ncbi:serine acetyltransferase, putative [Entamoeba invadens IP1]|uniref:serine O-acetyltransferase n=1 Tax=Entamoeba invadens IP1 TaxID=370355 RepID=A0A0A1U1B4_ENTIV|nr:serine acetyltransferase, putative [Entamoeba invadens IP1]ELP84698.1 serine acetyltransferase, putative [Entamoeba invadens IP1]|eukprot:XP_004184044.1 serine acetyltransferase, putative [Entamoeba invadens IP1]
MDSMISQVSSLLFTSYKEDNVAFTSSRQFPPKNTTTILTHLQALFFPDFFLRKTERNLRHTSAYLTELVEILRYGLSAYNEEDLVEDALQNVLINFLRIRSEIKEDIVAAYAGDPAAPGLAIIIRSYPGIQAVMAYRLAHILYTTGDREYCREMMEEIHSLTSIDIHPGAKIDSHFFIDHGVGVVIGETAEVGKWCRMYQEVTLGAINFKEENGIIKRGTKRHPTVGDNVVIGTGAKVLGNITIGNNVKIGAKCWIVESIEDGNTVFISQHPTQTTRENKHITVVNDKFVLQKLEDKETQKRNKDSDSITKEDEKVSSLEETSSSPDILMELSCTLLSHNFPMKCNV